MEGVHDDMVWYQMMKAIKQTRIGIKLRNKAEISWAEEMGYHRSTGSFIFLNAEFIPNSFLRENILFQRVSPCRQGLKTPALPVAGFKTPLRTLVCERVSEALSLAKRETGTLASLTSFSPWRLVLWRPRIDWIAPKIGSKVLA